MRTLRARLVLSHVVPLLIVLPLIAVALIYILETQIVLAGVSQELAQYAELTADMANQQPGIWRDAGEAQRFVTLYSVRSRSNVMLLDAEGNLLASSETGYSSTLPLANLTAVLGGQEQVTVNYTQRLEAEIVHVLMPVLGPNNEVLGVVRLSQDVSGVQDQLVHVRSLILLITGAALALAVVMALGLALNLGRSLQRVTEAIYGVASGREWQTLPEKGPAEIRTLLQAFNALTERLRVLEESRRRLLANLVHELGRPIGALQSALTALTGGAGDDPQLRRELLEGMNMQVQRLSPLLDSLTALHGQVLGSLELERQPVDLTEWLRRTVTPWREAAHDKGLHWRTDFPDGLPTLEIDPDRLAQVLGNLISNAIKYTLGGSVSVSGSVQGDQLGIVVADTGIGIAPSEREKIFEPFYRSQRDTRFPQGMGLGLSIARDIALAHGGRLEVDSQPGEGSRFTVWLPIEAATEPDPRS
jgi:two-component system sensor histidine kinase BaeS